MKKVAIFLAVFAAVCWTGCADNGAASKISYVNFDSNGNPQVYTLSADGKTSSKITVTIPAGSFFVVANPDATTLAYCRDNTVNGQTLTSIYSMDTSGKEKQLTNSANQGDCLPAFSPDGSKIAFESYRDGSTYVQIYTMNADGTNQTRVLTDSADNIDPQISPDGKSIVFFRYNSGVAGTQPARASFRQQWERMVRSSSLRTSKTASVFAQAITTGDGLYTVGIDGSNPKLVHSFTSGYGTAPVFTSDGTKILYTTTEFDPNGVDTEIAVINLDGTALANLSNDPSSPDYAPMIFNGKVLFNRDNADGFSDIFQMDMTGSNQTNLTNTPSGDEYLPGYYRVLN